MKAAFDPRPARASATGPNAVGAVPLTRMAPVAFPVDGGRAPADTDLAVDGMTAVTTVVRSGLDDS